MENNDDKENSERQLTKHLYLIPPIARQYANSGLSQQELIQEGRIGLMRATECHDASRPFVPLANKWIMLYVRGAALKRYRESTKYVSVDPEMECNRENGSGPYTKTMGGFIAVETATTDTADIFLLRTHTADFLKEILGEISRVVSKRERRLLMLRICLDSVNGNGYCGQLEAAKLLGWSAKEVREREKRLFSMLYTRLNLACKGVELEGTRAWLHDLIENIREVESRHAWRIIDECLREVPVFRSDRAMRQKIADGKTYPQDPDNRVYLTEQERLLPIRQFVDLIHSRGHVLSLSAAYRAKRQGFYMKPGYKRGGADRVYLEKIDFTYSPEILSYKYGIPINRAYKAKRKGFFVVNSSNCDRIIREGRDVTALLQQEKETATSLKGRIFFKEVPLTPADHKMPTRELMEKFCLHNLSTACQLRKRESAFVRLTQEQYEGYCSKNNIPLDNGEKEVTDHKT